MQWASQLHLEGVTHIIWANQKTSQSEVLYFCETFIYLLLLDLQTWLWREEFRKQSVWWKLAKQLKLLTAHLRF